MEFVCCVGGERKMALFLVFSSCHSFLAYRDNLRICASALLFLWWVWVILCGWRIWINVEQIKEEEWKGMVIPNCSGSERTSIKEEEREWERVNRRSGSEVSIVATTNEEDEENEVKDKTRLKRKDVGGWFKRIDMAGSRMGGHRQKKNW